MQHVEETWRHFFYYSFGLLPSIFFGLRFLLQWISSEKKKKSCVGKTFWYFSFCGNLLLSIHYFIQFQYLLFLIQIVNGFISWRNIDLLSGKPKNFNFSIVVLIFCFLSATFAFFVQSLCLDLPLHLLSQPIGLVRRNYNEISILWNVLGGMGCLLFASRFWIQWIEAEKTRVSRLNRNFWIISIIGNAVALTYFLHTRDRISILNYSFGLIPYIRNLVLVKKYGDMSEHVER